MGLMMNFLSLKDTFLISLQGNPIFGVSLMDGEKKIKIYRTLIGGKLF